MSSLPEMKRAWICIDDGSVEAEASAPSKYRSFCSGKVLVFGVLLAVSLGVISGVAVDNAAKSELIQAQSLTWGNDYGYGKCGKGKSGKTKSGKGTSGKSHGYDDYYHDDYYHDDYYYVDDYGYGKSGKGKSGKGKCGKSHGYDDYYYDDYYHDDYNYADDWVYAAQELVTVAENITDEAGVDV
jgi:hypothetical protein